MKFITRRTARPVRQLQQLRQKNTLLTGITILLALGILAAQIISFFTNKHE